MLLQHVAGQTLMKITLQIKAIHLDKLRFYFPLKKGKPGLGLFRWSKQVYEIKKMSTLAFSGWVLQENTFYILIKAINLVNKEARAGSKMKLSHCNQEHIRKKKKRMYQKRGSQLASVLPQKIVQKSSHLV